MMNTIHLERMTERNRMYRRVIATTENMQVVLMKIEKDIPLEKHLKSDQFFRVEKGGVAVETSSSKHGPFQCKRLYEGDSIIVPKGTWHRVIREGDMPAKLYTIYSPPHHPKNRRQLKQ